MTAQYSTAAAAAAFTAFAAHAGGEKALIWAHARTRFVEFSEPPKVLDFGCGSGWLARQAADEFGATAVGYDPSAEMVAAAKESSAGAHYTDDIKDAAKRGPYDLIFAIFVTPALPDKKALNAALRQTAKMLSPRGRFVVIGANPESVFARHAFSESHRPPEKPKAGATYQTDILKPDGSVLISVTDHYWPVDVIVRAAQKAGLRAVADCRFADPVDVMPKTFAFRALDFTRA